MTQVVARTRAFVVLIDEEVLLVAADDRQDAIRRLITDCMVKGVAEEVSAEDVTASLANGFISVREINGGVFAEPWDGTLPEDL